MVKELGGVKEHLLANSRGGCVRSSSFGGQLKQLTLLKARVCICTAKITRQKTNTLELRVR